MVRNGRRFAAVAVVFTAAFFVALCAIASEAQESISTKMNQRAELRESEAAAPERPAIVFRRRADNVVQAFVVSDDTRNAEARLAELKAALAALDDAAKKSKDVRIALVAETPDGLQLVRPFDRDRAIAAIANGERPD